MTIPHAHPILRILVDGGKPEIVDEPDMVAVRRVEAIVDLEI